MSTTEKPPGQERFQKRKEDVRRPVEPATARADLRGLYEEAARASLNGAKGCRACHQGVRPRWHVGDF